MHNRVKDYRQYHHLTQEALSQLTGVSRQTIIAIEKGKFDPSLSLAFKLSSILAVPIDWLFVPQKSPPNRPKNNSL